MNIAIVDDEQAEIDTLSSVIKEYAAANKAGLSLHTFHSAEELLAGYHPYAYTAIFSTCTVVWQPYMWNNSHFFVRLSITKAMAC